MSGSSSYLEPLFVALHTSRDKVDCCNLWRVFWPVTVTYCLSDLSRRGMLHLRASRVYPLLFGNGCCSWWQEARRCARWAKGRAILNGLSRFCGTDHRPHISICMVSQRVQKYTNAQFRYITCTSSFDCCAAPIRHSTKCCLSSYSMWRCRSWGPGAVSCRAIGSLIQRLDDAAAGWMSSAVLQSHLKGETGAGELAPALRLHMINVRAAQSLFQNVL